MPFPRYPSGSCPCQVSLPFELRHFPAGSLFPLSRIEFVSYRLVVLLRLLPTPPHDDAVAVEYGPENVCPVGTFTLLFKCAYERTGRVQGPLRNLATLEVFDPEAGEWESRTPMPTARSGLAAASFGGLLLVFGGEIPEVFQQNEVYDPVTDSWFELTPMAVPRHGIGAAVVGNRIIVPGGATIAGFQDTDVVDEFLVLDQLIAMAQFAEGPEVGSEVTATNFTGREVTARLELYDDQGNVLESGLSGPGGPERIVELEPYQIVRWIQGGPKLSGAAETRVGWALLFADRPLLGHILFTGPAGFAGVLGRAPGTSFLIPVERSQNQNSGIAVANASRFLSTVVIRLRDEAGARIADTEIELEPFGHRALFLDQLFPDLDLPSFVGSLEGSADQLTAALAILQRHSTQLATLPARIEAN